MAPKQLAVFQVFVNALFSDGALLEKIKQLIALAVAHTTQCTYCIRGHTRAALRCDAAPEKIMDAIQVTAEMRAGGAYAHSILALANRDIRAIPAAGECVLAG